MTDDLLADLIRRSKKMQDTISEYRSLNEQALNLKPDAESWSKLECLEHLNLYGDFYLPEMERSILNAKRPSWHVFKSGSDWKLFRETHAAERKRHQSKK